MKRLQLITWTLAIFVSMDAAAQGSERQDDTLEWLDDYDEAIALARETGKPMFLEFRCAP